MLQSVWNEISFRLRNTLRWSPGAYREVAEPTDHLFQSRSNASALESAADELIHRYGLEAFWQTASRERTLEVLTYLAFLAHFAEVAQAPLLPAGNDTPWRWLDVGAKNWSYLPALAHFARQFQGPCRIDGIELDPYRRYRDLHTRYDYAATYRQPYPEAQYHQSAILDWHVETPGYALISHFLPFVLSDPHLAWGLPQRYFQPRRHLAHLFSLLHPGGVMLIVNQGDWEAAAQEALLHEFQQDAALGEQLVIEWSGAMPKAFLEYRYPRYGWLCRRLTNNR